jgi:monosaccharide-transporting ATPase
MAGDMVLLQMSNISMTFPGVKALSNVNFDLRAGEVHALMGENGAGKSTLIKVITGVDKPEVGEITLEGKRIRPGSPLHAQELGISTVFQEVNLCPNLSVAENIFIGHETTRLGFIDSADAKAKAKQLLKQLDIDINVTRTLASYSVSIRQMVAIARALNVAKTKVLILDEPTSSLDAHEVQKLFEVMLKLKNVGIGIIFITHFIDQAYEVADRITVLRQGELVGTYITPQLSRLKLVNSMIGKELEGLENLSKTKWEIRKHTSVEPFMKIKNLGRKGSIQPFDLEIFQGEVLGFAGLVGSGRSEAARLIFGVDSPDSGMITVNKKEYRRFSPLKAILNGIGLCPEDRKTEGIISDLTVRENIILALQVSQGWLRYIPLKKQYEIADKFIQSLRIITPSADQLIKNLSGGNQQKVILARWLATQVKFLILDEPTRGIDIGTKAEIQKMILSLAEEGKAIVFISSELEEIVRCSTRVMIMRDHQKVSELSGEKVNPAEVMQTIAGRSVYANS